MCSPSGGVLSVSCSSDNRSEQMERRDAEKPWRLKIGGAQGYAKKLIEMNGSMLC
jgi:hypothetical protein